MAKVKKKIKKKVVRNRNKNRITKDYTLPNSLSKAVENLQGYSMLIYGKKKIGKTSLAAEMDDTLFLMCEPGGKSLKIYQVPVVNWRDFEGYVDLAIKDDRFKTIVIDTADYSYDYCSDHVCEKLVIDHPSDEAYGKGWKAVKQEYTRVINKLLHSGKGIVFISHSKDTEIKTRSNDSYHKVTSSMSGQAKDVLEGLIDIWVNYDYDGKRRYLIIQGTDEIDAGHRLNDHFLYPDGSRVEKIDMGSSPQEGYENFINAFNNHLKGGKKSVKKKVLKLRKK